MEQRIRAQKEILEVSGREQKRIGQDLRDGLAQNLGSNDLPRRPKLTVTVIHLNGGLQLKVKSSIFFAVINKGWRWSLPKSLCCK